MTLPEARRGYPSYRSASGREPARVDPSTARSRGHRISYDDVGRGPAVVLVHGFTLSGGDWWEPGYVERVVRLGQRVLVVDPLGHGQSDRPADPNEYRWPDVALDIVAAMDDAAVDRATMWGYSRGASLVAAAAAAIPDRVSRLILGAGGDIRSSPSPTLAPWIEGMLAGDWAAWWGTPVGSSYLPDDRRYCEQVNDVRALGASLAGRRLFPYETDPSRIESRTLVYSGSDDEPSENRRSAEVLGAEFHELAGLDHDTGLSNIDVVMPVVERFLLAAESETWNSESSRT